MDWLKDIVKHLEISRTLVAAVFVASVAMFCAPYIAPMDVPRLAEELLPFLFGVMVLTGALLSIWSLMGLWALSKQGVQRTSKVFANSSLSEAESMILLVLGRNPTTPLDLENIDYEQAPATKLEFHQLAAHLATKGLVRINDWDENLVSLTQTGRARALELQRQFKSRSAA